MRKINELEASNVMENLLKAAQNLFSTIGNDAFIKLNITDKFTDLEIAKMLRD